MNEQCERIFSGESQAGILVGVEAIRTTKLASKQGVQLDWNEEIGGQLDDRGFGEAQASPHELKNGIGLPIQTYSLFEHALRRQSGHSLERHRRQMCELFAPFSSVAKRNPYAQFPMSRDVEELLAIEGDNYQLAEVYTKHRGDL